MEKNTLEFIEKRNADLHSMLVDPVTPLSPPDKSDTQLFLEAGKDCPNPKLKLYWLLLQDKQSFQHYLHIARQAAELHDYVTALYWHEKISLSAWDIAGQFERLHYSACAERQRKEDPSAQPVRIARQLLAHQTEAGKALRDPSYLQIQHAFQKVEKEAYQKGFEEADAKIFQPLQKKIEKSTNTGCLGSIVVSILALVLLFYSVPKVWSWSYPFFMNMSYKFFVMELFTWLVPLLYILAVLVIAIVLISLSFHPSMKLEEQLEKLIANQENKIRRELPALTEESKAYFAMNDGLPAEHHNYPNRLVLAAISEIYGQENLEKIGKLWNQIEPDTWLLRMAGAKEKSKHPYDKIICRLLEDPSHRSDIFIACTLYMIGSPPTYSPYDNAEFDPAPLNGMLYSLDALTYVSTHIRSKKAADVLTQFIYSFLLKYYDIAKSTGNNRLLGEVCYQMYTCCNHPDIRYTYGREGIAHSDKLKLAVMRVAIGKIGKSYNLGYNRNDTIAYIQELKRKGDPQGEKLERALNRAIEFEKKQQQDALELQEMEREKARQQAEFRREKLRAELNKQADSWEQGINFAISGDYSTEFERNLRGELSDTDYYKGEFLRNKAIEKKLDELSDE